MLHRLWCSLLAAMLSATIALLRTVCARAQHAVQAVCRLWRAHRTLMRTDEHYAQALQLLLRAVLLIFGRRRDVHGASEVLARLLGHPRPHAPVVHRDQDRTGLDLAEDCPTEGFIPPF